MFEKNLEMSFLLDFYGDVLGERRREVMSMYYNEDLSLSEIADEIGISRQGVRDLIKKAEEELSVLEKKLGLAQKFGKVRACADRFFTVLRVLRQRIFPRFPSIRPYLRQARREERFFRSREKTANLRLSPI